MGDGGPRYEFADEVSPPPVPSRALPPTWFYPRGSVALLSSGPGTDGSQFVLFPRDSVASSGYETVGTVTGGLDIVDAVVAGGHDGTTLFRSGGGAPVLSTVIRTMTVTFG